MSTHYVPEPLLKVRGDAVASNTRGDPCTEDPNTNCYQHHEGIPTTRYRYPVKARGGCSKANDHWKKLPQPGGERRDKVFWKQEGGWRAEARSVDGLLFI